MDWPRVESGPSQAEHDQAHSCARNGWTGGSPARKAAAVQLPRPNYALPLLLAALWLTMMLLGGPHAPADAAIAGLFHYAALVPAARAATRLGDWPVLLPLTAAAALALLLIRSWRPALLFLAIVLSGRVLVEVQKIELARQRPDALGRLVHVTSLSFPSAHAAYSMLTWLSLALLLARPGSRAGAVAAALLVALVVGLSRLVLHVHWPSDVIGGWAFGAGWTLLLLRLAAGTGPARRH
jgi:membrane-associated phospholipid phosphatase